MDANRLQLIRRSRMVGRPPPASLRGPANVSPAERLGGQSCRLERIKQSVAGTFVHDEDHHESDCLRSLANERESANGIEVRCDGRWHSVERQGIAVGRATIETERTATEPHGSIKTDVKPHVLQILSALALRTAHSAPPREPNPAPIPAQSNAKSQRFIGGIQDQG